MDVFVARQAVLDRHLDVYGYELLFRSCLDETSNNRNDRLASSQVICNSFFSIGAEKLLGGKRAFINFPRDLLIDEQASILPPQIAVVEILETVEPDPEVIAACRNLKSRGYLLALDDFARQRSDPLSQFADIIKVDFQATTKAEQEGLLQLYGSRGIRMLAEKVETQEEFERARRMGYCYFQGYFFARPVVFSSREVPGFKLNYLRILREIHSPELQYDQLETLIRQELSLSYKLLRYVNSVAFYPRTEIHSIKQALVFLGENEIRKWVSLVTLLDLAVDKPAELVVTALLRARFCESLAGWAGLSRRQSDLFLMGMFSLLDAIVGRPLEELLGELALADDVRDALLGKASRESRMAAVYELVLAYEKGEWEGLSKTASRLGVPKEVIPDVYVDAISWSEQIFRA